MPHPFRPLMVEITDEIQHRPYQFLPQDQGRFRAASDVQVKAISENINEGNALVGAEVIDAYPDVWARALLFEQALYNRSHVMHQRVWNEWCGFLALLALCRIRNLQHFWAEELRLDPIQTPHPFIKALASMKPTSQLSPDNPWTELHVFQLGGSPIGMTSPQTLICTSVEYAIRDPKISWLTPEGILKSPVGLLREQESVELLCWLNRLHQHLKGLLNNTYISPQPTHQYALQDLILGYTQQLLTHLQNQAQAQPLREALQNTFQYPQPDSRLEAFAARPGLSVHIDAVTLANRPYQAHNPAYQFKGLYATFNTSVSPPQVQPGQSHVRVQPTLAKPDQPTLLLLDPALPLALGKSPDQVLVYGTHTMAEIDMPYLGSDRTALNGKALDNTRWITPEQCFTPILNVIVSDQKPLPGSFDIAGMHGLRYDNAQVTPLVPIAEELLQFLSADDLQRKVTFVQQNHQIRVSLTLNLGTEKTTYTISKIYADEAIRIVPFVPSVDIWPNFEHPDINLYLTYYSAYYQPYNSFYAKPWLSQATQQDYIRFNSADEHIEERIQNKQITSQPKDNAINLEICRLNRFPEAMLCYSQVDNGSGAVTQTYEGMILLQPPKKINRQQGKKAVIGVDLGTSSTNVYININHDCRPVIFEDSGKSLFQTVVDAQYLTHYNSFLPKPTKGALEKAPLLTLFKVKHQPEQANTILESVLHGHVHFIEDYSGFDAKTDSLKKDLKWGGGGQNQSYLTPFLEQLCLQATMSALSEGIDRLEFRFSYPSAFSQQQMAGFRQAITNSLRKISHYCRLVDPTQAMPQAPMRESVATTYFFATGKAAIPAAQFQRGVVVLDIGGGTTDIAVIEGSENAFRYLGSVKLAGRDLFLNSIWRHPEVLGPLGIQLNEPLPGYSRSVPVWLYPQLDAVVKGNEKEIMERLPHCDSSVTPLINSLAIGVAGLLYYVSMVIEYLRHTGKYNGDPIPRFYVGGNAAKIFHWFNFGHYEPGSIYDPLFEAAFNRTPLKEVYDAPQTTIKIYPTPAQFGSKPEVAYGLVLDSGNMALKLEGAHISQTVTGEPFTLVGGETAGEHPYYDTIRRQEIVNLDTYSLQGQQLGQFIDIVNSCAAFMELPTIPRDKVLRDVVGALQQDLNDLQGKVRREGDDRFISDEGALFIQELKLLLNHI